MSEITVMIPVAPGTLKAEVRSEGIVRSAPTNENPEGVKVVDLFQQGLEALVVTGEPEMTAQILRMAADAVERAEGAR